MPIQIVPERPDTPDARALIDELQTALALLYPAENQFGYSVEKLLQQNVAFFVIRVDDAPAACGGVQLFGNEYGEIKRMFVRPQFRGRGLGKLMLAQLEAYAHARGVPLLRLETGTLQTEAIGLYEQYGFARIPPFGDYPDTPLNMYFEKRVAPGLEQIKNYPRVAQRDIQIVSQRVVEDLQRALLVIQTPFGYKRAAEIFAPQDAHTCAAILFVHWYEPHSPDSNRYQFVAEAKEIARSGSVCMLVETLWSDIDFFIKRTQANDIENSVQEAVNLRRALDVLLQQPGVDPKRVAYVGHDFGGMYGVLMGSADQRPTHYVVMAATPRFPDWYLYAPEMTDAARETFQLQMAAYDPITHIAKLAPAPVLFQFATADFHVPNERAQEFFDAAREPKDLKWYVAGHGLNAYATDERKEWLRQQLRLAQK
jgi:GNAT superfamily N-acetyltransferase/dienelactone hydrolase